jgi:hypothetical protein
MIKSWHISRRTMLRGVGTAVALPWLEAMSAVQAAETIDGKPPLRIVFVYHPLGAETNAWKGVTGAGKDMKLTPTLAPLEPVKEHLLVVDGLNGRPHPQSGHNRSACLWLSSATAGKADAWGAETDVTLDQVLAPKLSAGARQKSLELSCTTIGKLMHAMNISWRGPGVPLGAETRPSDVFSRMLGDVEVDRRRKSILDVVGEDAHQLKLKLGCADHRRLDEYLESVRSLERQIADFEQGAADRPEPPIARPGEPEGLRHHVRLMVDLLIVALQIDYTRVITCALGDESEAIQGTTYNRTLDEFGIDKTQFAGQIDPKYYDWGHHKCSHDPQPTLPIIQAIDHWYVEQFAYLLQRLQATREGDGTLLDHNIVVYGCANGGGQGKGWPGHDLRDVACILAGRGGGLLPKPGRQIDFYGSEKQDWKRGAPLSNLWLTLAQMVGVERKEFGRSDGTLSGLG